MTDSMEIYWGADCQIQVTPAASQEVCVALISRDRTRGWTMCCAVFRNSQIIWTRACHRALRGTVSSSRSLKKVAQGPVALIEDASGSVDAITGEGLCLSFKQAFALAEALETGDLRGYQDEHRRLWRRPEFMADLMLSFSLDRFPRVRHRSLRALAAKLEIFAALLAAHIEGSRQPDCSFVKPSFGWRVLTVGAA